MAQVTNEVLIEQMTQIVYGNVQKPEYHQTDLLPIKIPSLKSTDEEVVESISHAYLEKGFVIFELADDEPCEAALLQFAKSLGLGQPYVPETYQTIESYRSLGLNVISFKKKTDETQYQHAGFETMEGQKLHSDGTLQEIGFIKSSVLLCVNPAWHGGISTVFHSVGAFIELFRQDKDAAVALMHPECLTRTDVGRSNKSYVGPAFTISNGEIISRFSIDNTSDWSYGIENVAHLSCGLEKLLNMAQEGSPFYLETKLERKQGILMANDKISHGRTKFEDAEGNERKLIRGLFLDRPSR